MTNTIKIRAEGARLASATPQNGTESVQVRVLLQLRELILSGELAGGARIAELAIVQRLAASRLPLEREGEREGEREAERFERRGEPSSGSRELDRSAGSSLLENSAGEVEGGGAEIKEDLRSRR